MLPVRPDDTTCQADWPYQLDRIAAPVRPVAVEPGPWHAAVRGFSWRLANWRRERARRDGEGGTGCSGSTGSLEVVQQRSGGGAGDLHEQ